MVASGRNYIPRKRQLLQSALLIPPKKRSFMPFKKITDGSKRCHFEEPGCFSFCFAFGKQKKHIYWYQKFQPPSVIAPFKIFRNEVFNDVAGGIYRLKLADGCWKQFVNI